MNVLFNRFLPRNFYHFIMALSKFFDAFLGFIVPLVVLTCIAVNVTSLSRNTKGLLLVAITLTCNSALVTNSTSCLMSSDLFPRFVDRNTLSRVTTATSTSLAPFFSVALRPIVSALSTITLTFIVKLYLSSVHKGRVKGDLCGKVDSFSGVVSGILRAVVVPLLPLCVYKAFASVAVSKGAFTVLDVL